MSSVDLWYTTRATGLAALVLLTATLFLGILTAGRATSALPAFARAEIHRRLSILTVVFLALHVLTTVVDTYVHVSLLAIIIPFSSNYHRFWLALGTIGVDFFIAVAVSSALRQHLSARTWRLLHWLAYVSWPVAIAHAWGMGTDAKLNWVLGLFIASVASIVGVTTWRVVTAIRLRASQPKTNISARRSLRARAYATSYTKENP
jgi:methionine sulfoxide reductase heme-binding subunit